MDSGWIISLVPQVEQSQRSHRLFYLVGARMSA